MLKAQQLLDRAARRQAHLHFVMVEPMRGLLLGRR
jgi:hypothetical protein